MKIQTWADIQAYINGRNLPYTVLRFNMSLAGRLIDTATGETLASTIDEAKQVLQEVLA